MEEDGSSANGDVEETSSSSSAPWGGFSNIGRWGGGGPDEREDEVGVAGDESPRRGTKLLLGVANVGGSLTVLLQIALVAWGIRQLRSMLGRRRERQEAAKLARIAMLSPVAVHRLVELDAVPHFLVDVRERDAGSDTPAPFDSVLHIPESELKASLSLSESEWKKRFPSEGKPSKKDFLVFLCPTGEGAQRAASVAADLGYSGCGVLTGGIQAYLAEMSNYEDAPLKSLSRDAVAALMEKQKNGSRSFLLLDVRRPDEVSRFGQISGSKNIPVIDLPKALKLDEGAWKKTYHFPKIADNDTVIFQCRESGRATWAAQLARDAGLKHCFVYRDGSFGWRLDQAVLPYSSFQLGEPVPDPINFEVDKVDYEAGKEELQQLGLA